MPSSKAILGWLLVLGLASGAGACARTDSFSHFRQLESELQKAHAAEADRYAASAYDYWYAVECLEKAKREHGRADFKWSDGFAVDGLAAAKRAGAAAAEKGKLVEEPKPEALAEEKRKWKSQKPVRKVTPRPVAPKAAPAPVDSGDEPRKSELPSGSEGGNHDAE